MSEITNCLRLFSGLLTPLLGIIATFIIVQQFVLERNRWKLDLFDKRYLIYDKTKNYIFKVSGEHKISQNDLITFLGETKDAEFLFRKDINDYLKLLYSKGNDLILIHSKVQTVMDEDKRMIALDKEKLLLDWFSSQLIVASRKFGKYLKINN